MKKVAAAILIAASILLGIQLVPDATDKIALEITTTGDDRVLLAAIAYEPSAGRSVQSIVCDAVSLTKTGQTGSLEGMLEIELWLLVSPGVGTLPVTITMTEDCVAEAALINLTDAHQGSTIAGQRTAVGQNVTSATVYKDGGDATVIIVFSSPASRTLATPAGFEELISEARGMDVRLTMLQDDDASAASADLVFSGAVNFTAFILGVNLAP